MDNNSFMEKMSEDLQKKVEQAIKLLQSVGNNGKRTLEVSYSGGKDSDVILELAKMSGVNFRAIYKNTSIDPPGTIKHCMDMGVDIVRPKQTFFQLIEKKGFPNRHARFCCQLLKEYKILDYAVQGIRRSESKAREKRYKEPMVCRLYGKGEHCNVILPILEWTDSDVTEFIKIRHIKCAPVYYSGGMFNVKKRLGCMGCPMKSDNGRLADFKNYPNLVKGWCRAGKKFMDNHPDSKSHKKFGNVFRYFTYNVFFHSYQEFIEGTSGFFGNVDCKEFLENYFKIKF